MISSGVAARATLGTASTIATAVMASKRRSIVVAPSVGPRDWAGPSCFRSGRPAARAANASRYSTPQACGPPW